MLLESRKMHFEQSKRGKEQQGTSHPSAVARGVFFTFFGMIHLFLFTLLSHSRGFNGMASGSVTEDVDQNL